MDEARGLSAGDVTVLLVDDDPMVRGWVRIALEGTEFRVAGEAFETGAVLDLVRRRNPDLLLVDYRLGQAKGTELLRALRQEGVQTEAVLMTANPERGLNEAAREAGAKGTVLKTGSADELARTLRAVVRGDQAFDSRHPPRPSQQGALSPREREALRLVAEGLTNHQIAERLGIGSETVKTLLARTFTKLGVQRRAEAVAVAHERGLL